MEYKIGQILISTKDIEVKKRWTDEVVTFPKGDKVIIGADKYAHHLNGRCYQPLESGSEIKGYDTEGLTEYILNGLCKDLPFEKCLESQNLTKKDITEEIEFLLEDIGL